jgi:hypothetical protein
MKKMTLLLLAFLLGITGCASLSPEITSKIVQTAIAQTLTALPTSSPLPETSTPTLSPSTTATATARIAAVSDTPQNVATIIADPEPDFSQAQVYGLAHLGNGHFLVTIEIPGSAGNLKEKYTALLNEDESLRCIILEEYPNRLYCNGPTEYAGKYVLFQLFNQISNEVVFETQIGVPPSPYLSKQGTVPGKKPSGSGNPPSPTENPSPTATPVPPYPYP